MKSNYSSFELPEKMEHVHWTVLLAPKPLNKRQMFAGFCLLLITVGMHNGQDSDQVTWQG
jgi:hypothetical protein